MESIFKFHVEKIKFQSRPNSIEATSRLSWKLAFILFLVGRTAGVNSVSMKRLGLFNWALQEESRFYLLREILIERNRIALIAIKYEPTLSRSLLYLQALKMVELKKGKYRLTILGMKIVEEIENSEHIFFNEKNILRQFSKSQISEVRVTSILGGQ